MACSRGKRKSSRGDLNKPPSKKGLRSSSVSGVLTTPPSTLTLGNASCANQATNSQGSTGQTKSRSSNQHTRGTVNVPAPSHENRDRDHDATHDDTQFLRRQDIPTLVQEVLKSFSPSNTDSTIATTLNVGQQDTPEATVTICEEITIGTAVLRLRIPKARLPILYCLSPLQQLAVLDYLQVCQGFLHFH